MKKMLALFTLFTFGVGLPLVTGVNAQGIKPITIQASAGGVGGVWYIVLAGIAEVVKEKVPEIQIKVVPGGGLINPIRVGKGDVQMAILFAPQAAGSYNGVDPFTEKTPDIRMIAGGFGNNYVQFVAAEETGLTSFEDVIKKKYPRSKTDSSPRSKRDRRIPRLRLFVSPASPFPCPESDRPAQ